ncbi:MAG: tRNA preQ1(34) S-adenosylmethionine ribosyltransferase-isomerase QueA [Campylobacterota bacterium]|nr:tRNA preQ1(34) S-adenosylmethionine ribosyltransferase-isomerase QueA [Campylobacterota bacterium]
MLNPLKTSSYDYHLPDELIATHPLKPRENARLLVYNRANNTIIHDFFYNIDKHLPKDAALIFNDTKVIKARLYGEKRSGGKIELLINRPLDAHHINVYIKGRVKEATEIFFENDLVATVLKLYEDGSRDVSFTCKGIDLRFEELLPIIEQIGHIPLPPYLQRDDNQEDIINYQSVFAKFEGAVAAPTASLHFSDALFDKVCQNHTHAFVTLHVGAGTFKPVQSETITEHPMHSEYFSISNEAKTLLDSSQKIVAFGTTSTRTIEYYARTKAQSGEANLFLHPNNKPIRANHLLTNFHLPKSTLLMLVASFVGLEEAQAIYKEAIEKEYRFFSYGDAMLIL